MSKNMTIKEIQITKDLSTGALNSIISNDAFNNYSIKMIKIKSTTELVETVTLSTVEKDPTFNTILYSKAFTAGTDFVITADDNFMFKEGVDFNLNITNNTNIGTVYVTIYISVI